MNVSLISYTPDALHLLLFTKQTRLSMDSGLMEEIRAWPEEKKMAELDYMLKTIESSWEFVDYTFSLSGVSRAFTHQLVRTRDASYAQQSQRTVNMEGFDYVWPEQFELDQNFIDAYTGAMESINDSYQHLIQIGAKPQDARAVLPTNVATNIIVKVNLATLSRMAEKRLCYRTQGEYQTIFRQMRLAVLAVHPWADPFIRVGCAKRGVCQFPNFTECPIKPGIFNPETGEVWPDKNGNQFQPNRAYAYTHISPEGKRFPIGMALRPLTKSEIQERWESTRFEAVPKEMKREQ